MAVIVTVSAMRAVMLVVIVCSGRRLRRVRFVAGMFVHVFSLYDKAPNK